MNKKSERTIAILLPLLKRNIKPGKATCMLSKEWYNEFEKELGFSPKGDWSLPQSPASLTRIITSNQNLLLSKGYVVKLHNRVHARGYCIRSKNDMN